jgi:hypothetical protein
MEPLHSSAPPGTLSAKVRTLFSAFVALMVGCALVWSAYWWMRLAPVDSPTLRLFR